MFNAPWVIILIMRNAIHDFLFLNPNNQNIIASIASVIIMRIDTKIIDLDNNFPGLSVLSAKFSVDVVILF